MTIALAGPKSVDSVASEHLKRYKQHKAGRVASNGISHSYPSQKAMFSIEDSPIENLRPIKVIVIGAGFSGIYCGIRIPEKIRNVELVIYDKNAGIGGTWWENRYPGCACDVPSHSYQYSFEPNLDWSSLYAPAAEIRNYLQQTAHKYGADRFIKLSHQITKCCFDEDSGKWHVNVTDLVTGEAFEDTSDILISGRGNLNAIAWPQIEGLDTFKGELMHSAKWNEGYDFRNKRIGVIGSGSSAIQIIPNLQKLPGTQLSCFIRSPTWISPPFGQELWDSLGITNYDVSDELRSQFHSDPLRYDEFRLAVEEGGNSIHDVTMIGTKLQIESHKFFKQSMISKLSSRPDIQASLLPSFPPGCRRLTPGIGFLEALIEPNVDFVPREINQIESNGVRTSDGQFRKLDVLVCATGFQTAAAPPFPVLGQSSLSLQKRWKDRPENYLSLTVDKFPNHFMMLGPSGAIATGSLTMMIEATGDYIVKCIRKIQKENIKSMSVKPARVRDFTAYADAYFEKTVFSGDCSSWYKKKGKVVGLWPGSTLHCLEALRSPRWEDYEYDYLGENGDGEEGNGLGWLGNGSSVKQYENKDLAWYLYPEFQELPEVGAPEQAKRYKIRPFSH